MYLSRLILNPMHRGVQRDLCNCQDLHRTVMSGFPQVPQGMDARAYYSVLYRLESRKNNELSLLVQSRVCPDWSQLPQGYLAADTISENPACKPLEGFLARIKDGAYLMFRLLANPTVRKPIRSEEVGTRNHGRRIAIRNDAARIGWLCRKGTVSGFELLPVDDYPDVLDVQVNPEQRITGISRAGWIVIEPVKFEGRLKVTSAEAFRDALIKGIGPGKSYGLGLLSVAPLRI